MTNRTVGYAPQELMAIVIARDLEDGLVGMSGANSEIPVAASLLAQRLHAPNLTLLTSSGFVNPKPVELFPSSCEYRFTRGAEAILNFYEVFENSERGLDFMFYGGIQIDQYGNVNLTYVGGTYDRPRFRGPGLANVSMGVMCPRIYLYPTNHTKNTFVERVDFVTIPGWLDGPEGRRRAGIETPGPRLVVSPRAVLDFEPATRRMRLVSVHEHSSVEDVVANTSFELVIPDQVPITPPPTVEELRTLREEIDVAGVLRSGA
ncbi:MAG TPA: CoA-transferase [Dehalococcoidia bacterium]|nr:CoA-transferase [Dehalococcoidia bacterium]